MASRALNELLPTAPTGIAITGLALDSRRVQRGDLFLAYPGDSVDGRDFIAQAVASGAVAIAAEPGRQVQAAVPVIEVPGLRAQVSQIADRFYGSPSAALTVIGVTGTNGKTSVTQLIGQALRLAGRRCGVIGTLGASADGAIDTSGSLTTPDPVALQRQLAEWRDAGVDCVAMEVSSHGLDQGRVNGIRFRSAVLTNLSRDHLDYHGDMASYGAAKAKLFELPGLEFAVLNLDDAFGRELQQKLQGHLPALGYSLQRAASLFVQRDHYRSDGVDADVVTPWGRLQLHSRLLGDFNLSNLLAVVAVLGQLGLDHRALERIAPQLRPIPGRMERVVVDGAGGDSDIEVIVDYAHTPDALEHALRALRRHCAHQLWAVFGCGGDRDRGKRPLMGAVAEQLADHVVITSDNPRSETPQQIIDDIAAGLSRPALIEADRARAIALAVDRARAGDLLLLAGKGHEDYQQTGTEKLPFSDIDCARAALARRAAA